MKKIILKLVILLGFAVQSWGQVNKGVDTTHTNTYIIEYDLQTGTYDKNLLRLKVNTPVVYKIKNINRLAYDVKITSKDSILAETFISEELTSVKSKTLENLGSTVEIALNNGIVSNPTSLGMESINKNDIAKEKLEKSSPNNDKINKIITNIIRDIPDIEKRTQELSLLKKKNDELKLNSNVYNNEKKGDSIKIILINKTIEETIKEINDLEKESNNSVEIKKLQTRIESNNIQLKIIEDNIGNYEAKIKKTKESLEKNLKEQDSLSIIINDITENLKEEFVKKFNQDNVFLQESFYNFRDVYKEILKLKQSYQEIKSIADNPFLSKEYYMINHKEKVYLNAQKILLQRELLLSFKIIYDEVNINYSHLKYNPYLLEHFEYGGQVKLFSQADYIKELSDRMNKEVKGLDLQLLLDKLQHLLCSLEKEETYTMESSPIQPLNDVAIFNISIRKKSGNSADISNERVFKHREFTYGGTRIDFSLGLGASYFANTDVYELGSVENTVTKLRETKILKKSNYLAVPSLLGLVTMSYRKTGYITFGASAGLGIDVVNGKIQLSNFFGGPTVLFGKFDRLFLTIGGSVRNVGQLKGGYREGDVIPSGNNDIEDFITDKYKIGGFIALTYNLTKGAKENYKRIKNF